MKSKATGLINDIDDNFLAGNPFVIFRKPTENLLNAFVQNSTEIFVAKTYEESGFIFAPFYSNEQKILFPIENCQHKIANIKGDFSLKKNEKGYKSFAVETSKDFHIDLVKKGMDFINNQQAKKIVLSRKEVIDCPHFNLMETFKKMLNNYKNAFVYVWFHPKIGLWLGATPEKLMEIEQDTLRTMALAGTQKFKKGKNIGWQEKEKKEQQFVTDYIQSNLSNLLTNIKISIPYTVKAGNLFHLRSDVSGKLKKKGEVKELIGALHPTPAVCGLPKEEAMHFIRQHENYKRSFYTGFLGCLNMDSFTDLYVNLRCMEIKDKQALIFVGGGITKESNPEKEWEETVSKTKTMENVL